MQKTLNSINLLFLRSFFGLTMAFAHGLPKFQKILAGGTIRFPDPLGIGNFASLCLATFSELVCSLLIVLGFRVRIVATFPLSTMFVAFFIIHKGEPWAEKEPSGLFLFFYLTMILMGPGQYTVPALFSKSKSKSRSK